MVVPVRGRVHLAAKMAYAVAVTLVLLGLIVLGLLAWAAVLAHTQGMTLGEFLEPLRTAVETAGMGTTLAYVGCSNVLGAICLVIQAGAVMSISAQGRFNHLGFGAPLVGFILLYVVSEILGLVATLFLPIGMDLSTGDLTSRIMWPEFLEAVRTGVDPTVVGVGSVLVGPLLAAVLVWWAVRAIERHTCLR